MTEFIFGTNIKFHFQRFLEKIFKFNISKREDAVIIFEGGDPIFQYVHFCHLNKSGNRYQYAVCGIEKSMCGSIMCEKFIDVILLELGVLLHFP